MWAKIHFNYGRNFLWRDLVANWLLLFKVVTLNRKGGIFIFI